MERSNVSSRHQFILKHLTCLPKKILSIHGSDNITQFVLHDLCSKHCFDIPKAAYFVDNPDFNCFKGIAGYSSDDCYPDDDCWKNPASFSKFMEHCLFNRSVKSIENHSPCLSNEQDTELINNLSKQLSFNHPHHFKWTMKHDNHGFLIYEKPEGADFEEEFIESFSILGLCPLF